MGTLIPILYEANETAFRTQGLGSLADAISVSVSRVVNGKDELTMVYPSTGVRYSDLASDCIIYAQPEYRKDPQPYQIYQITKPLNGMITVYARHVGSQRAAYIPVTPFTAGSAAEVFVNLPNHLVEQNPFTFSTTKTTTANFKLTRPASLGKVLGGMEGSILDVFGGEYEFDKYEIKLLTRRGRDSGVTLRYGKNITDIEQSEDFGSIITGVVPYWEGMDGTVVKLPENVIEGQYADTYSFRRTIVKDFSESFDEQPTVAQLRAAATDYVANNNISLPTLNLKVSFEHLAQYTGYENLQLLETLNLGDTVSIYYEPLGISAIARIVKTNYDCLNEKYVSVQIGSVKSDLEQVMSRTTKDVAQVKESVTQTIPSLIDTAVEHATDLITGVDGGYYIVNKDANGHPYETLWMDTDDKATATYVIRINENGIGFSKTGYNGPYTNAWTIDGQFVADFITAGTLNANIIRAGIITDALGKNSWNLDTGEFVTKRGRIGRYDITDTYIETFRTDGDPTTCAGMGGAMAFWAGDSSSASAPFRVTYKGELTCTGAKIVDGKITASYTNPKEFKVADYSSSDITTLRNYIQNHTPVTQAMLDRYDFNCDGSLTMADLIKLRNMLNVNKNIKNVTVATIDPSANGEVLKITYTRYENTITDTITIDGTGITVSYYDPETRTTKRTIINEADIHSDSIYPLGSSYPINDFVIEEGYSSPWYWRKWNSGYAEAWARVAHTLNFSQAWGAVYTADIDPEAYPFTFRSGTQPIEQVSAVGAKSGTDNSCWLCNYGGQTGPTDSQTGKYQAIRPVRGSATIRIAYYVRGLL